MKDSSTEYRLFDKRDNFSFDIVNFPDLSGNVPTNQSYGVFISQMVRFARCCQKFVDFTSRTLSLVERLLKQHFKYIKLCKTFKKFSTKYGYLLKKYHDVRSYDLTLLLQSIGDGGGMPTRALKKHPWLLISK